MKNKYLQEIVSTLEKIKHQAQETFGSLDPEQLNWKSAPEKWSIGQCIDHLIVSNKTYFPELNSLIKGEETKNFWKKVPLLSGFAGNILLKAIVSRSGKKYKAPDIFQPSDGPINPNIVNDFTGHQDTLISMIRETDRFDHEDVIITSPVAKYITYSLVDAFSIITAHEKRHFEQALGVLGSENFPR